MAEQDFEKLLATVERLNTQIANSAGQIERLQTKMQGFQAQISEGGLGTFQIKQLNDQISTLQGKITDLQSKMSSKQLRIQSIMDDKSIRDSTKEFEALQKSIRTLQEKTFGKNPSGQIPEYLKGTYWGKFLTDVKNAENALASFQSRMMKNYTPLGTRITPEVEKSLADARTVPESRIALTGYSKEESALIENRQAILNKGREAAQAAINMLQRELIEGAIQAKTNLVSGLMDDIGRFDAEIGAAMAAGGRQPGDPPGWTRPQGYTGPPPNHVPGGGGQRDTGFDWSKTRADFFTEDFAQPLGADRANEAARRAAAEKELLDSLKNRIRTEKRYESVMRALEKQGFTIDDLVFGRTRGTAGVQELRFRKSDSTGVQQQLDLFNTPGGKTTPGISNQFRTFGQGVLRDVGELTKWSIALAAIYGPMRKLQELTQEMIDNQTKLAEATISVNSAYIDQSKIFEISADAANNAGEAISGVIDAFTQAYRATGGQGDQITRLAAAQKLLADSLTLSKLSSLDQASAIDTLSAAVRQTGGDFNVTTALLDKWVRVTKVANVDLATLATGFAVLGDAAETAQIGTDELNGILGAIAETGVASGKEVANTARAIVSGFQSDNARKELEALGIAVEDTTGQMRPFMDIMRDVYSLRQEKIIDDTQFSRLTLALGGGTRRQAAYTTLIENLDRVSQIAGESANASGDSAAALAKQLDTVQTSLTKLANSFTELAQTMGMEGGFLSIIQGSVDSMTSLVGIFNSLISVLGKATPAMAAFIATSLILKQRGQGGIQQAIFGYGQSLVKDPLADRLYGMETGAFSSVKPPISTGTGAKNFIGTNILGTNLSSGVVQGLLLSAIPAIMNITNKQDRFGGVKAGADIIGGVGGAIVGTLVAGSPLIGAAVGTAISEAFVNSTIARKTDLFGYGQQTVFGEPTKPTLQTKQDAEVALTSAQSEVYKSIGFGNENFGRFLASSTEKAAAKMIEQINEAIATQNEEALNQAIGTGPQYGNQPSYILDLLGLTPEQLKTAFAQGQTLTASPERAAYSLATPEAQKLVDQAFQAYKAVASSDETTAFGKMVSQNEEAYGDLLESIKDTSKTELSGQRLAGDIKGSEYARRTAAIGTFDVKALQYYTAFGDEFIAVEENIGSAEEAFQAFNQILISGTADTVPEITQIVSEISKLINILNSPEAKDVDWLKSMGFDSLDDVNTKLAELRETGANLLSDVYAQSQLAGLSIPNISGDISKPLTTDENKLVEQRTKQLQDSFYQGFLQFSDSQYEALKDSFDEFAVTIKDSGDEFYKKVTETDEQFRQAAIQQLQEEGKLASQQAFGIQQVDMPFQELQPTVDYYSNYLAQEFPEYKQNPEDVGIIFSDYVTDVLHGDNLAIKLALEKIVDLNQKQLDGMYNIPEGATFWVPLTAAYYRPKNEGGAGGLPAVDATAVDGNTVATDSNTRALEQLSSVMSNTDRLKLEYPDKEKPNPANQFRGDQGYSRNPIDTYIEQMVAQYSKMITDYGNTAAATGFRRDPGYAPRANDQSVGFIQQLLDGLRNFFTGVGNQFPNRPGPFGPATEGIGSISNRTEAAQPQPVQARLDLRFDNSVQLIVDGRVLANVITPYLSSDLVKLEASQGTITKRYVI